MVRKLKLVHLWLGLILSVPLTILSITGALLIFGTEIQSRIAPAEWFIEEPGPALPVETLLERVAGQLPDVRVAFISANPPAGEAWRFWLADGKGVANVNPVNGDVLKHYNNNETAYGYVRQLHRWLLAPKGELRHWARNLVCIVALIVIVQLIVGIWLWAIPPKRLKRLKIPPKANTRFLLMRLHTLTGLGFSVILVVVALTGISFHWRGAIENLVSFATLSEIRPRVNTEAGSHPGKLNIDGAVQVALDRIEGSRLASLNVPKTSQQAVTVRVTTPGISNPNFIAVDPVTLEILGTRLAQDITRAEAVMNAAYKIHVGNFAGTAIRCLWIIVSLMPVFYISTGIWFYWNRRSVRRMRGVNSRGPIRT